MIITTYQFYCVHERVAIPVIENYHYIIISKPYKKNNSNNLYKNNLYSNNLYIHNILIITLCYTYE